eukprot:scaffold111350_cov18-Phaeocystis_antarctica.AAC.1
MAEIRTSATWSVHRSSARGVSVLWMSAGEKMAPKSASCRASIWRKRQLSVSARTWVAQGRGAKGEGGGGG